MKTRMRSVLAGVLLAAVVLGLAAPVAAQGTDPACNGLSDADCEILLGSTEAMRGISSFSVPDWSFVLELQGGEEAVLMEAGGSALFAVPPEAGAVFANLPADMAALDFTPFVSLLNDIDAEWVEQLLDEALVYLALDSLIIDSATENGAVQGLEVALKEGVFYAHLPSPTGADEWFGEPVALTARDREEIDDALEEMRAELAAGLDDPDFAEAMAMLDQLMQSMEGLNAVVGQYVTTTRLADEMVGTQPVAVFETTFDLPGLLNDPDLAASIVEMLNDPAFIDMMEQDGAEFDPGEITQAQVQLILATTAIIFDETIFRSETWVGLEDGYLYLSAGEVGFNFDGSLFGVEAGEQPLWFDMAYEVSLADFDAVSAEQVQVPAAYSPLRDAEDYLVGDPSMIVDEIDPGTPLSVDSRTLDEMGGQTLYALELDAGDAVTVSLATGGYALVEVYGPDGFYLGDVDASGDDTLEFTAEESGTHVVQIVRHWAMDHEVYELNVTVD